MRVYVVDQKSLCRLQTNDQIQTHRWIAYFVPHLSCITSRKLRVSANVKILFFS